MRSLFPSNAVEPGESTIRPSRRHQRGQVKQPSDARGGKTFQRQCNLDMVGVGLKVIWEMSTKVYIGCGAGFSGDRFDAAIPVVETLSTCDGPRFLIFEVLAERTLAIAQRLRLSDPNAGYSPYLDHYIEPILKQAKANDIRIISNLGAANPIGAAKRVHAIAKNLGVQDLKIPVVLGDDLLGVYGADEVRALPTIEGISLADREIVAANVYLGAQPISDALALDVDVVLVGRTTDAALTLGPLLHVHGWAADDWDALAQGTVAGHLLECAGQVTGAYFADPGFKDVENLAEVGFPIAEIDASGEVIITKAQGTGGLVSKATVTEQILYEMHDPANYLTPDVTLDVMDVSLEQIAPHRVRVTGAKGKPPPDTLKVTVSVDGGWLGEGEITYAGPNALARAELAADIIRRRSQILAIQEPVRIDIIGTGAVHDNDMSAKRKRDVLPKYGEYRVRAAIRSVDQKTAQTISDEVQRLYTSGPAAGGGVRQYVTAQVSTASVLIEPEKVLPHVRVEEITP